MLLESARFTTESVPGTATMIITGKTKFMLKADTVHAIELSLKGKVLQHSNGHGILVIEIITIIPKQPYHFYRAVLRELDGDPRNYPIDPIPPLGGVPEALACSCH